MSTHAQLEGVWKSYPRWRAGSRSVRSMLTPAMRAQRRSRDVNWALRDVSFHLGSRMALGVIGHNGAGKSTLLRLVAGLGRPTRGQIRIVSGAAAVLSLGDVFNLELTGRENAITAAMVAGQRASRARALVPEVMRFAELEEFEDAPMRSYSEGMKLRLAFGVIAQLEPELLILDEVLAVGDVSFQEKCLGRIRELRSGGMSLLFASHSLEQVAEECDQTLWLDHGRVRGFGDSEEIVERYRDAMATATRRLTPTSGERRGALVLGENRFGSQEVTIHDVVVSSAGVGGEVAPGGTLEVAMTLRAPEHRQQVVVSVSIRRPEGDVGVVALSSDMDEVRIGPVNHRGVRVVVAVDELELVPGKYRLDVGAYPPDWAHAYDYHWQAYPLTVRGGYLGDALYRPSRRRWLVDSC